MTEPHRSRVMVVDVDDDLRGTLCEVLTEAGFRPTCAPDVDTARRKLSADPPDVLLLSWDAHAGAADKAALVEEVPERTAVILMSTNPSVAKIAEGFGVPFVSKPFELDAFLALVERSTQPP